MSYDLIDFHTIEGRLTSLANTFEGLKNMPERIGPNDISEAIRFMREATTMMRHLRTQPLPGCTCRRVVDDCDYARFIPDEKCPHHGFQAKEMREHEEAYRLWQKKVEAPYRAQLAAAALQGMIVATGNRLIAVDMALEYADAVLAKLKE